MVQERLASAAPHSACDMSFNFYPDPFSKTLAKTGAADYSFLCSVEHKNE
jgi:hypothetical protein